MIPIITVGDFRRLWLLESSALNKSESFFSENYRDLTGIVRSGHCRFVQSPPQKERKLEKTLEHCRIFAASRLDALS